MEKTKDEKGNATNMLPIPLEKDLVGMSANCRQVIRGLTATLNEPIIDLRKLRAYMANGLPEEAAYLREVAWKVVLGYLPRVKSKW